MLKPSSINHHDKLKMPAQITSAKMNFQLHAYHGWIMVSRFHMNLPKKKKLNKNQKCNSITIKRMKLFVGTGVEMK